MTATSLALMPDFLDPVTLIGYFGTWALVGLPIVVFVESGVLFPVLPGDTLLFVGGMLAAGTAAKADASVGTSMFKPNARFLKQRYLDEAHAR
jgi:membrane-associated protein